MGSGSGPRLDGSTMATVPPGSQWADGCSMEETHRPARVPTCRLGDQDSESSDQPRAARDPRRGLRPQLVVRHSVTVKAVVWQGPRQMAMGEWAPPRLGEGWVAVRPEAAGICGSEVEGYVGRQPNRRPPLVMGHELAGVVAEAGPGADPAWLGRRVAVNPIVSCHACPLCGAGERNLCPTRRLIGVHDPGGFAELVAAPQASLVPLPDGMAPWLGAL